MVRCQVGDGLCVHGTVGIHGDVSQLGQCPDPVVPDPTPYPETRQRTFIEYPAAPVAALLGQGHLKALPGGHQRGFQTRRSTPHHQQVLRVVGLPELLGMPVPAPLLPGSGVLGAAHRDTVVPAGDTDIAANAFPDGVALAPAHFVG